MTIARVALDVPLPRLFDYLAPDATTNDIGRLVAVPFGRGTRLGVLVAVGDTSDHAIDKLKSTQAIRRDLPAMPMDWMQLTQFCAGYYQYPLGEVMTLALPPMLRRGRLPVRRKAALPERPAAIAPPQASSILATLRIPMMIFSSQNKNSSGKTSQWKKNTPASGTRFASTSAMTDG